MDTIHQPHDLLEAEYDRYPYDSFPFAHSHPIHLHTLGTLFGLTPSPVENARILELGGASGGNVIPIAFRFPNAQLLGIDLSSKEIEEGNRHIQALSLHNITLRHQSILDFSPEEGLFDYIICHGVYSWVNDEVREKILRICSNNLSPHGIAYISYNTFPGWNTVNSVRELMLWHTKKITAPSEKATQARNILKFVVRGLDKDTSPYAQFLKNEIEIISQHADSYLLHDHLSTYNAPTYFYQFAEKAHAHGLTYLADSTLATMFSDNLPAVFSDEIKKVNDIVVAGQYMDFIRNQRFRATLLCHAHQKINRALKTDDVQKYYLQLTANCQTPNLTEDTLRTQDAIAFSAGQATLTVRHLIAKWGLYLLHQQADHFISYFTLCEQIMQKMQMDDLEKIKLTLNNEINLIRAALAGIIELSTYPSYHTHQLCPHPLACPLSQYQYSIQAPFLTNRRHQAIKLNPVEKVIFPYLDGKHAISDLQKILLDEINNGTLTIFDNEKNPITASEKLQQYVPLFCQQGLDNLLKQALLI